MELCSKTAWEVRDLVLSGRVSAREVVQSLFARIAETEPSIEAYTALCEERALERAGAIDATLARGGSPGRLAGIPITVKDNICARGLPTTAASRILDGFVPPYDATAVERLCREGAIVVGKTNLDEFGMGSSCENSGRQITRNPWDLERVPGGSSGGSAAAVAAGSAFAALGSDTGGSIRQPASLCGVVGMKPTYGLVSRYGLIAFASSLDQIGPITKDVRDAALLLEVMGGHDPRDSTSCSRGIPNLLDDLECLPQNARLGLPAEYFDAEVAHEVKGAVLAACERFRDLGAEIVEIRLPHTEYAIATYQIIATAEASSNLARYDGVHYGYRTREAEDMVDLCCRSRNEGFGPEVKRRILLGTFVLSAGYYDAYYMKALRVRHRIREDFRRAFEKVDAILCPTSPVPAFRIGEKITDPLTMYAVDIFTVSTNLAGIPAISIPCGFTGEGLPIGLQILGRRLDDGRVLRLARAFERVTERHARRVPP
jgi:aspartyl-tRNA(Asn)/glutamyl-tRNA(Gln) amidotransferase subunit A